MKQIWPTYLRKSLTPEFTDLSVGYFDVTLVSLSFTDRKRQLYE
jgi:hypothetical protein